jgi:hypothetical protein
MAIIYTYPIKTTSANRNDLILISDSADKNKTKQISVAKLPGGIDFVGVGGNGTAGKIPKWSTQYDLTDSSISEDSVTGNIGIGIQPNGSALATLDVSKNGLDTDQPIIRITQRKDDTGWPVAEMGRFEFFSSDGSGNSPYNLGYVGISNDYVGGTLPSGAMTFATTPYNATGGSEAAIERMRIASNGNVGIGQTNPNAQLDILDTASQTAIRVINDSYNNYLIQKTRSDNTQILGIQEFGSNGGLSLVTGGSQRLNINNVGNVGIGTTSPAGELQVAGANPNIYFTSNDTGQSDLYFGGATAPTKGNIKYSDNADSFFFSVNTNTVALMLSSAGNVGIGTNSPDAKLEVIGNYKQKALDSNIGGFTISVNSGTDAVDLNNYYNAPLTFSTNNAEKMRITGSGNVGIGNTNPNHKLTVGIIGNETNIACASTGFDSLRLGQLTFPSAAGWYRVASYSAAGARGGARIDLCITGGAFAPVTYSIDYFKSYTQGGTEHTLKLEQYGGSAFITKARIAFDGTSTFVEVYKIATTSGTPPAPATMDAQVHFNRLIGESGGSLPMFGTATSGSGSTLLKEVFFIAKGTSVESLRVEGVCVIKNIKNLPTSVSGLSTGDIWNNSGVLNIAP